MIVGHSETHADPEMEVGPERVFGAPAVFVRAAQIADEFPIT
jgi:hypothetical protein